ncbi:MAG: GNAT family N-acetyltransferase [Gallionella sp.]|jgi:N-acetylglutamate synthase-like GNAT family acetyltransferase
MEVQFDNPSHCKDFVRLNEQWISEYFSIEEVDRRLAENPMQIVASGGHIISLVERGRVVGVCALFKENANCYELARMAVDPQERGKGYGARLIQAAINRAQELGASSVYLLSNTALEPAIALYRKFGFVTRTEGQHPVYARANIVMELNVLQEGDSSNA